jgi:hypothetical protein
VPRKPVFALDQNFPSVTMPPLPDIDFIPLRQLYPDLIRDHDDWDVLRELKRRGGVDGLITLDDNIVKLPKEMSVLHQTRLSLVVFRNVNNDPLVATDLLLVHASAIARSNDRRRPQLWVLSKPLSTPSNPWDEIKKLADRRGISAEELYRAEHLAPQEVMHIPDA